MYEGLAVLLFVVLFVVCVAASGRSKRRVSKAGRKRSSTAAMPAAEKKAAGEKRQRQGQANDSFWKRTGHENEKASTAEGSSAGAHGSTTYESTVGVSNAGE